MDSLFSGDEDFVSELAALDDDDAIESIFGGGESRNKYAAAKSGLAKIGKPGSYVASVGAPPVPDFSRVEAVSGPDGAEATLQRMAQNNAAADAQFREDGQTTDSPLEAVIRGGSPIGIFGNAMDANSAGDFIDRQTKTVANASRGAFNLMGKVFNPFVTVAQDIHQETDWRAGDNPSLPAQAAKATIDFATGRPILEGMGAMGEGMEEAKRIAQGLGLSKDQSEIAVEGLAAAIPFGGAKLKKAGDSFMHGRRVRAFHEGKLPSDIKPPSTMERMTDAIVDAERAQIAEQRAALIAEGKPVPRELQSDLTRDLIDAVADTPSGHLDEFERRKMEGARQVDEAAEQTTATLDQVALEMDRTPNMPAALDMFRKFDPTDPPAYMINPMMRWAEPMFSKVQRIAEKTGFIWEPRAVGSNYATLRTQLDGRMALDEIETATAIEDLRAATEVLDQDGKHRVRQFMAGEIDTLGDVPIETVQTVVKIKKDVFGLTEAQVQRKILSREVADEYQAGFLARVFEKEQGFFPKVGSRPPSATGLEFPHIRRDAPAVVVTAPQELIEALAENFETTILKEMDTRRLAKTVPGPNGPVPKFKPGTTRTLVKFKKGDVASRDAFVDLLSDPEVRKLNGIERKPYLRKIEELTPEQLEELGQILDPEVPLATTLYRSRRRILQHDFLKSLESMDEGGRPLVVNEPTPGYLPVESKGPLQGKFLDEGVHKDIEAHFGPSPEHSFGRQVWDGFLAGWKLNKTVLSPRTAARQLYSMPYFFGYGGLEAMKHIPAAMRSMKKGTPAFRKWDKLFTEWGIDGGARFTEAEIIKVVNKAKEMKGAVSMEVPLTGRKLQVTGRRLGTLMSAPWADFNTVKGAARIYNMPDVVTRKALFMHYVDDLGMSPARATLEVNKWTPNYQQVGKAVDRIRKSPFGAPFFTFKAEMYRIQANALREKPIVFALQMASNKLLQGAAGYVLADALGAFGEDDALLERERRAITTMKGNGAMPIGRDSEGRQRVFDTSFIDPNTETRELLERAGDVFTRLLGTDFRFNEKRDASLDQNPLLDALEPGGFGLSPGVSVPSKLVFGVDPENGRKATHPLGKPGLFAQDIMPGLTPYIGRDANRIGAAMEGEQPSRNRAKQDVFSSALDSLLGLTSTPFDPDLEEERAAMRYKQLIGEEVGKLRRQERSYNPIKTSESSVESRIKEYTRRFEKQETALDGARR